MNIIFITRRFYPQIGGVETHVLQLSRELISRGHSVTVITEMPKNLRNKKKDKYQGIDIVRINVGEEGFLKKFKVWNEILKFNSLIKKSDIVHCHDVFFWYLPFRFIFPNKKVYTTFHGYETRFPVSKKAVVVRKISEFLSHGNICVGDYISKYYGTKPGFVIYGGVDEAYKKSNTKKVNSISNKIKIVLIGRLDFDTGVETYLRALSLLKKKKIGYEFRSYGDGIFKADARKYGMTSGFVLNVKKEIGKSDIVFASSYLIILQALIMKKKIIAIFDNPLKEDYLKMSPMGKYIYLCKNETEIVEVVKSIKRDPWKSDSMIEQGYKWAKMQTWEKILNVYLNLWNQGIKIINA